MNKLKINELQKLIMRRYQYNSVDELMLLMIKDFPAVDIYYMLGVSFVSYYKYLSAIKKGSECYNIVHKRLIKLMEVLKYEA